MEENPGPTIFDIIDPMRTVSADYSQGNETLFGENAGKQCVAMSLTAIIYLTNRFHVAVRLFSNRSQMTSKCGKNKKVAHEALAECVTDVLTTF